MHLLRALTVGLIVRAPGHLRGRVPRLGGPILALFAAAVLAASLVACTTSPAHDDFQPSQTVEARDGRSAMRAMLGLAPLPEIPTDALATQAKEYDAVASHMLVRMERQEPGVFDRFGVEVASRDGARFIAAWTAMQARVNALTDSPALLDDLRSDPSFQGAGIRAFDLGASATGLALTDDQPPQDGIPNLGRGPDGFFGDGKTGAAQASRDLGGLLADPFTPGRTLAQVDSGALVPDPSSRLGAYKCTAGNGPGTVGRAVHNAIGFIYESLGTYGEEKIGRVFCDPQAIALFNDPVTSDSSLRIAQIEQRYWDNVRREDPFSAGGQLGAAFSPAARNVLQRHVFAGDNAPAPGSSSANANAGADASTAADAGADAPAATTDCGDKADGWYCIDYGANVGWMMYCKERTITSGCPCSACLGAKTGTAASCSSAAPPAACTSN